MKYVDAVGDRVSWSQVCPLAEMPISQSRNELWSICEKLDFHATYLVT